MKIFLEQRGELPDDSQPTRMVSIKELQELHDARKDAEQMGLSDNRRTSTSSTSSSFATGRTSIVERRTSIAVPQMRETKPVKRFPDAIEMHGEDHVDPPAAKRTKAAAEC